MHVSTATVFERQKIIQHEDLFVTETVNWPITAVIDVNDSRRSTQAVCVPIGTLLIN